MEKGGKKTQERRIECHMQLLSVTRSEERPRSRAGGGAMRVKVKVETNVEKRKRGRHQVWVLHGSYARRREKDRSCNKVVTVGVGEECE